MTTVIAQEIKVQGQKQLANNKNVPETTEVQKKQSLKEDTVEIKNKTVEKAPKQEKKIEQSYIDQICNGISSTFSSFMEGIGLWSSNLEEIQEAKKALPQEFKTKLDKAAKTITAAYSKLLESEKVDSNSKKFIKEALDEIKEKPDTAVLVYMDLMKKQAITKSFKDAGLINELKQASDSTVDIIKAIKDFKKNQKIESAVMEDLDKREAEVYINKDIADMQIKCDETGCKLESKKDISEKALETIEDRADLASKNAELKIQKYKNPEAQKILEDHKSFESTSNEASSLVEKQQELSKEAIKKDPKLKDEIINKTKEAYSKEIAQSPILEKAMKENDKKYSEALANTSSSKNKDIKRSLDAVIADIESISAAKDQKDPAIKILKMSLTEAKNTDPLFFARYMALGLEQSGFINNSEAYIQDALNGNFSIFNDHLGSADDSSFLSWIDAADSYTNGAFQENTPPAITNENSYSYKESSTYQSYNQKAQSQSLELSKSHQTEDEKKQEKNEKEYGVKAASIAKKYGIKASDFRTLIKALKESGVPLSDLLALVKGDINELYKLIPSLALARQREVVGILAKNLNQKELALKIARHEI